MRSGTTRCDCLAVLDEADSRCGAGEPYERSAERGETIVSTSVFGARNADISTMWSTDENGDDICLPAQSNLSLSSLPNPVLDKSRWQAVMDVVTQELLTPVGLRSLSPSDPRLQEPL